MRNLPYEQVEALGVSFKKAKRKREAIRYQALYLLARNYSRKQVQEILKVSRTTLEDWVTKYRKFSLEGLKDKQQLGNHRKLTNKQKEELKDILTQKTPENVGLIPKMIQPIQI